MKTTELRIGSLVDVINRSNKVHLPHNIIKKVGRIEFFKVNLYEPDKPFAIQGENWEVDVKDLSPIPLTRDWLLKFGFQFRDSSTCTQWFIGMNEVTHDWLFDLTWLENPVIINAPDAPFYRNGKHTIRYVHQLQNLYFSLTGDELEILGTDAKALVER